MSALRQQIEKLSAKTPDPHGDAPPQVSAPVMVWDLAVRVFHWSLVSAVAACWWTGGTGDRTHEILGYTILGLVAFRIAWGFGGTLHARFADFLRGPGDVRHYLQTLTRGKAARHIGHNPAGGAMIAALLATLLALSATGWLMLTRRLFGVPWVEDLHRLAADALLVLIALHLCGVIGSSILHRENLVLAMLTGSKRLSAEQEKLEAETQASVPRAGASRRVAEGLAILVLLAGIGFCYGWFSTAHRVIVPAPIETGTR